MQLKVMLMTRTQETRLADSKYYDSLVCYIKWITSTEGGMYWEVP